MGENEFAGFVLACIILGIFAFIFFSKQETFLIVEKKHEHVSLLFLSDAEKLISPFMEMKGHKKLLVSNKRLKKLKKDIGKWFENNPPIGMSQMFPKHQILDEKVEEMFKEYADICSAYLD